MEKQTEKAVYKFNADCGRHGNLEGLFVAKKDHVKQLVERKIKVYFGEVLGKHSEIYGVIREKEIKMISDEQNVIDVIEKYNLENGYNPLDYTAIGMGERFDDLTVLEIIEILEKECEK